jgi:hypothetical protein
MRHAGANFHLTHEWAFLSRCNDAVPAAAEKLFSGFIWGRALRLCGRSPSKLREAGE